MFHKINCSKHRKKYSSTHYTKGQVFTLDFIIGFMLFLMVILLSVKILLSMPLSESDISLHRESVFLSNTVLSQGYPYDWNDTTVIIPGISDNNRIDLKKLTYLDNMTYTRAKTLYHISNDYIFFFSNNTGIINLSKCSYGAPVSYNQNCNINLSSIAYTNLVKIDRLVILNSSIVKMTFYMWNN